MTELQAGMKPTELAQSLGVAPSWVSDRLAELRLELLFANGRFPPLDEEGYESLRDSIAKRGVLVPVAVDEDGELIDGHERQRAARELGKPCPTEVYAGLSESEKRALSFALNASRRHLTRIEKNMLVVAELMHDDSRSDREIARVAGVTHPTVSKIRKRIHADELAYQGAEPEPEDEALVVKLSTAQLDSLVGTAECPCCSSQLRAVKRAGVGLVLEVA